MPEAEFIAFQDLEGFVRLLQDSQNFMGLDVYLFTESFCFLLKRDESAVLQNEMVLGHYHMHFSAPLCVGMLNKVCHFLQYGMIRLQVSFLSVPLCRNNSRLIRP